MEKEILNDEALASDADVPSEDGESADEVVDDGTDELSLDELNDVLGKDFKDKGSALKALKDTFNYVGKAGKQAKIAEYVKETLGVSDDKVQEKLQELISTNKNMENETPSKNDGNFITKEQYEADMFYANNPQYKDHRDLINAIAKANGVTVQDAVNTDIFKNTFEKVSGYDEIQSKRTVLESNPKLGAISDKSNEAKKSYNKAINAAAKGNHAGAMQEYNNARKSAVSSVVGALDV